MKATWTNVKFAGAFGIPVAGWTSLGMVVGTPEAEAAVEAAVAIPLGP